MLSNQFGAQADHFHGAARTHKIYLCCLYSILVSDAAGDTVGKVAYQVRRQKCNICARALPSILHPRQ